MNEFPVNPGVQHRNCRQRFLRIAGLVWIVLISGNMTTWALDPSRLISQYAHTAWRVQDGYFAGGANAITQTTDGYLWIGTMGGLVRFDGVRFVPFAPPGGDQLRSTTVISLLGARDGSLWIGTTAGITRWSNGKLLNFPLTGRINHILEDQQGTIWFARSRVNGEPSGPLCQVKGEDLRCFGTADGIPFPYATALASGGPSDIWLGSSNRVSHWVNGTVTTLEVPELKNNEGLGGVNSLTVASDGALWVGLSVAGPGLGFQRLQAGTWDQVKTAGFDTSSLGVFSSRFDRQGSLWVGTTEQGIYRIRHGSIDRFRSADGLSGDAINAIFEDREGTVWIATSKGIDNFRDLSIISYSIREGLSAELAGSVLAARDGRVFIGNLGSMDELANGQIRSINPRSGLPGQQVTSMLEDRAGRIWLGVDDGLAIYENGKFTSVLRSDGSRFGVAIALTEDSEDNVWAQVIGTPAKLVRVAGRTIKEEFPVPQVPAAAALAADPQSGIWLGLINGDLARYRHGQVELFHPNYEVAPSPVRQLLVTPEGAVLGATSRGVVGWREGRTQILTSKNGLPCDSIHSLVFDQMGALWLYTACGVVSIGPESLGHWWQDPAATIPVRILDVLDGALPASASFRPGASRSLDGRLWFANDNIVQVVDPGNLVKNDLAPPVHIEAVTADRTSYAPQQDLQLPPLTRELQIDYTALSFVAPQKMRFRYQLVGHDADWVEPGTRRQAFYSDLRPGHYRFQVIASNNDGVWNQTGAVLEFTIRPRFYQTGWFLALCLGSIVGLFVTGYRWRVVQVKRRIRAQYEARLAERTRIAQDLHDTLLQGIVSASMQLDVAVDQVPDTIPAKARFERVHHLLRQVIRQGRSTVEGLRTVGPAAANNAMALENSFADLQQELDLNKTIEFSVIVEGAARPLTPLVHDAVYRIGHEALVNAYHHSQADKIEIELEYAAKSFRLLVRDNGIGIEPEIVRAGRKGHWGLSGMRERAEVAGASLKVWSRPAAGTEVELSIPNRIAFRGQPKTAGRPDRSNWLRRWFKSGSAGKGEQT